MDSHEYGPQPSHTPPSGLPVPPHAEPAPPPPTQTWAGAEPSGLPSQGWVQPTAAPLQAAFGQPAGLPPATDPADGPTLSAFSAYGQSPAGPGQVPAPPYGQAPSPAHADPGHVTQPPYGQPPSHAFAGPGSTTQPPSPAYADPGYMTQPYGGTPAPGPMSPDGGPGWPPPYLVPPPAAPGPYVPRRGPGAKIAAAIVAGVVLLGGACAVAADTWAKAQICDAVQQLTDGFTSGAGGADDGDAAVPTSEAFDRAEDGLNSQARLLFFHGDLKDATHGLADDIASVKHLLRADLGDADLTEMAAVAISFDSHVRTAQRECGQPERSVFDRPS